jgi:hypothetical protein
VGRLRGRIAAASHTRSRFRVGARRHGAGSSGDSARSHRPCSAGPDAPIHSGWCTRTGNGKRAAAPSARGLAPAHDRHRPARGRPAPASLPCVGSSASR